MILETIRLNKNVIILSLIVSLGGLLFGFDTGVISGIMEMKFFVETFTRQKSFEKISPQGGYSLEPWIKSLMVGLPNLGMFTGAISSGVCGDKFGRKRSIIYASIIFTVGVVIQIAAYKNLGTFLVGRLVAGLGIGLLSGLIPVYQAECAPKQIRGALISIYQFAITVGLVLSSVANYVTREYDGTKSYNIPIGVQLLFVLFLFVGMVFVPESPRYLYTTGNEHKAAESILYIHNAQTVTKEIQEELSEIAYDIERSLTEENVTYISLFNKHNIRRTLIAAFSQFFQQFTGINFIFYFGVSFFKMAGLGNPFLGTIIAGFVNVVSTLPGVYLVDKMGRKAILLIGAVVMFISQFLIGVFGALSPDQTSTPYGVYILVASCVFVAAFAGSWGIGAWIVCSEVFSQSTRSKGNSIAVATNWAVNSAIGFATPLLVDVNNGGAGLGARVGFLWSFFIFCSILYVYFFVPETKNLSLETINRLFNEKVPATDVAAWSGARVAEDAINNYSLKRAANAFELEPSSAQQDSAEQPLTSDIPNITDDTPASGANK